MDPWAFRGHNHSSWRFRLTGCGTLLSDPRAWVQFDDQLQGLPERSGWLRLRTGDRIKVVPKALIRGFLHAATAPAATIVTADPDREIAWRQDQPGGYTEQRWTIQPTDGGTTLTRHIQVIGPFAAPLGAALAEPLTADLGAVGARMIRMAAPGPDQSQPLNIIAGGSGYLGSRLATRLLAAGHRAVVLTRSPQTDAPYPQVRWSADDLGPLHDHLLDDAGFNIFNLVGRRLGAKFTSKEVAALAASRIEPMETLRAAVTTAEAQGGVLHRWIQGSAVPLWAANSTKEFTETTSPTADRDGPSGMGQLVTDWEAAAPDDAIIAPARGCAGHRIARSPTDCSGRQPVQDAPERRWVFALDSRRRLGRYREPPVDRCANHRSVVVAVAPQQTRLSSHCRASSRAGHTKHPVPARLLNFAMNIIRMEPGMLMGSTRARSTVLENTGYHFRYPTVAAAADAVGV